MNKIISVLAIIFCVTFFAHESKAQGNLQFNQVILFDLASGATQAISVPPGKVWKIETANTGNGSSGAVWIRNASSQAIAQLSTSNTSSSSNYPFWLPSGYSGNFYNVSVGRACVSIIEFNVVP